MDYRETKTFTIVLELEASFPEDYEGEEDGFEWYARFDETIRPRIGQTLVALLAADRGWRVTPMARGHADAERLELRVERMIG